MDYRRIYTDEEIRDAVMMARGLFKTMGHRNARLLSQVMRAVDGVEYNQGQKIMFNRKDREILRQIELFE